MAHYPVLWDGQTNILYAGTTSTLGPRPAPDPLPRDVRPHPRADHRRQPGHSLAEARGERSVEDFGPVGVPRRGRPTRPGRLVRHRPDRPDFWGNEFLIWLWHTLQTDGDTLALPDGSEATVMVAKTLTLDCPRGETGRDCLTNEGPTRLPEAFRALQAGKLPRKAGPDPRPPRRRSTS